MKCQHLRRFGLLLLLPLLMTACTTAGGYVRPWSRPSSEPTSITIEPRVATNPVGTQHTVKATVRDAAGKAVHSGLVEWILARTPGAVGDIVGVSQDPWTRGTKVDNTYAITGLDYNGESSITITSPVEGITHIIAAMPDIKDPAKHKAFAVKNWLDAKWEFPPAATNRVGSKHPMAVKVVRASDGTPLEGYEIRWKVASGPPAVFEESRESEAVTKTDENGIAHATLAQVSPAAGVNQIDTVITKPRDTGHACCPTPYGELARGSTTKTWVAPAISIQKTCPPSVVKGGGGQFSFTVSNASAVDAGDVTVKDVLPAGFEYVGSSPEGQAEGGAVTWKLGTLPAGGSRTITVTARANTTGPATNEVTATAEGGLEARAACNTVVTEPRITIAKQCPAEGLVGDALNYVVTVQNPGSAPATNVFVTDTVPEGMRQASGQPEVGWRVGDLAAGASITETFTFTAGRTGTFTNRVKVSASGDLSDRAECNTVIREPKISIQKRGRDRQVVGRTVAYTITVANGGTAPASGVVVNDQIPSGMSYVSSSPAGAYDPATRTVTWNLGTLPAESERTLEVVLKGDSEGRFCDIAAVTADRNLSDRAQACSVFAGVPGVLLEVVDDPDPVEIGSTTTYTIVVTNQGSTTLTNIGMAATIPEGEQYASHVAATAVQVAGPKVTFAPVARVAPGQKVTYSITVRATGVPGQDELDVRFIVDLTADQLSRPVVQEESTHLYR